jgi:hypothetical protein
VRTFLKTWRTRITTTTTSLKLWLVRRLLHFGIPVEIELRHGAHRARVVTLWRGQLLRAEIPINTKPAGTSSPLGYVAPGEEQKIIDAATASGPWDPFPGMDHKRGQACPFCGHTEWVE